MAARPHQLPRRARARRARRLLALLAVALGVAAVASLAAFARGTPTPTPTPTATVARVPKIAVPRGLAPIARFTKIAENSVFHGHTLPAGWSVGAPGSHGFEATTFQASQVSLNGSEVALTASSQSANGYPYQGAWITTQGRFSLNHGLIDVRARMPVGQGLWSGLWAVNPDTDPVQGELDIQEMLLGNPHTLYGSLHGWKPGPTWSTQTAKTVKADLSHGYHDYQVVWQRGMITWAIDGVAYAQYTEAQAHAAGHPWPFDSISTYLIADLAVGRSWGGPPSASTAFPATMRIESVRVWE